MLAVPGCAETSTLADLPGLWVLATVDTQQAPPFIVYKGCGTNGNMLIIELVAESIALDLNRDARRHIITHTTEYQDSVPTGPPVVFDLISVGVFATTQSAVIGPTDDAVYLNLGPPPPGDTTGSPGWYFMYLQRVDTFLVKRAAVNTNCPGGLAGGDRLAWYTRR